MLLGGCIDQTSDPLPRGIAAAHPIDGQVDFTAFAGVRQALLEFSDALGTGAPTGKLTLLRWWTTNDDRHLYVALEWDDATHDNGFDLELGPVDFDGAKLLFDSDGDGTYEAGEDARTILAAAVGSQYVDQHASTGEETDTIGDGQAKLSYDAALDRYRAELLIPLAADANGEDGDLTASSRFSILLFDHVQPLASTGNATGLHGVSGIGTSTFGWEELDLVEAGPHVHPVLPDDLTGLIVFLSDHEGGYPEVYAFDPATRQTTRVTNAPGLYKENVSLSHDRTRVAFHGAADPDDFASYEIFVVNVDGTGLTQLTTNAWLDGHPGWSPDDSRIVYASRRDGKFSIITMLADGTEIADLTPPAFDETDPDYLPDGRIVFKTDRFSSFPQVRIAVMNGDGSNVRQLSFVAGVSDHDPIGTNAFVLFERFPKSTSYVTDPDAMFVPWDLVEVTLSGAVERTVLSDGWLNWLPQLDPSGRYALYLKTQGYTAAHLVTLGGVELGRLIPDQTRITYADWK